MTKINDWEIPTPELDKVSEVREKSQAIGEFLDWLQGVKGITFAVRHEHDKDCGPWLRSQGGPVCGFTNGELITARLQPVECLLAEFFHIDLNVVECERRAILDAIRTKV